MKIVFYEITDQKEIEQLTQNLSDHELIFHDYPLTPITHITDANADIICVFVCSNVTTDVINKFKKLKLILTRSTGYNHIDVNTARDHNVTVCNIPTYASVAVAEYTFALLLAMMRKVGSAFRGIELYQKTCGVIGLGCIGKHVARIAHGFGMNVIACDIQQPAINNVTYVSQEQLFQTADVISLHVPLTKQTHHLINTHTIQYIKPGAFLINTSRGDIVDTQALLQALNTNILAGAAVDVLEDETYAYNPQKLLDQPAPDKKDVVTALANQILMKHPKALVSLHNAFNSVEAEQRMIADTIATLAAFSNNTIINQIT